MAAPAPLVISREEIRAVYAQGPEAVIALVETLVARIHALEARVTALEAAQARDSHNSGKPPSSDVSRAGRAPKSLRGRSGKPPGGQPGHPGRSLALRATPDAVATHLPAGCAQCGYVFTPVDPPAVPVAGERRQVFELPAVALVCTEHRLGERACSACGAWTRGAFPPEARATVQYGPGLLALGLYLTTQHLLPVARAAEVLTTLTGQPISPATLLAAEGRCAATLAPVTARILGGLARSPAVHLDETAFYVVDTPTGRGPAARWWLHVACTPALTHYTAPPRRGTVAHAAVGLLPTYTGTAVHDGYGAYATHTGCRHALCGVHLLRELTFLAEEGAPATRRWAAAFKRALRAMKGGADRARDAGAGALDRATLARYRRRYDALLAQGETAEPPPVRVAARGHPTRSPGAQLLHRLRRDRDAVLRFLHDFAVPFDNSQAERDVRMMKVEQKVSGGFRTPTGAATFCTNRGYLSTARKQGQPPLTVLRDALLGTPFLPAIP